MAHARRDSDKTGRPSAFVSRPLRVDGVGLGDITGDVVGTRNVPGHHLRALLRSALARAAPMPARPDHQCQGSGYVAHVAPFPSVQAIPYPASCQSLPRNPLSRRPSGEGDHAATSNPRMASTRHRSREPARTPSHTGESPSSAQAPAGSDSPSGSPGPARETSCSSRPPTASAAPDVRHLPGSGLRRPVPPLLVSFARKPDWTNLRRAAGDLRYLEDCDERFGISGHVCRRPHRVGRAGTRGPGRWRLTDAKAVSSPGVLVSAVGMFDTPSSPTSPGSSPSPVRASTRPAGTTATISTDAGGGDRHRGQRRPRSSRASPSCAAGRRLPTQPGVGPAPHRPAVHRRREGPLRRRPRSWPGVTAEQLDRSFEHTLAFRYGGAGPPGSRRWPPATSTTGSRSRRAAGEKLTPDYPFGC